MVVRRSTYPQVDPRAAGLLTRAVLPVPAGLAIEEALRLARRRRSQLAVAPVGGEWAGVTPATLERAVELGLSGAPLRAVLWGAPVVGLATPEVEVRRRLGPAVPFVVVLERGVPAGAVFGDPDRPPSWPRSAGNRLERCPAWMAEVMEKAAAAAQARGFRLALVGGLPRDLMLGEPVPTRPDVDLVVEGEADTLGRELASALDGALEREHPPFRTASLALPGGRRVDLTTARRERYRAPGALPEVVPASLEEDLWRRDFSVNALAVRLGGTAHGQLLDPTGGLADLRCRRLRVLHPLSFVEDPTRMFRAVRLASRLGCRLERTTRRLLREATRLDVFGALSGERLRTELALVIREPAPATVLARLGRLGVFRLLLPLYRFPGSAVTLLSRAADRGVELGISGETQEALYVLALTAHLDPDDAGAWQRRLGLPPGLVAALGRARQEAPALATRLGGTGDAGEAYGVLRQVPELVAAWAAVCAREAAVRRTVRAALGPWRSLRPLLTGDDLVALGVPAGPAVGRWRLELLKAQAGGRLETREEAFAWMRESLKRQTKPID
jgi:tRNA nucleotidyltransferase (CCA-adding enzyme)